MKEEILEFIETLREEGHLEQDTVTLSANELDQFLTNVENYVEFCEDRLEDL